MNSHVDIVCRANGGFRGPPWGRLFGIGRLRLPASRATHLDPLGPLVHGLHVIIELGDIGEASKILLLLGQEVLSELVQVPVLSQL